MSSTQLTEYFCVTPLIVSSVAEKLSRNSVSSSNVPTLGTRGLERDHRGGVCKESLQGLAVYHSNILPYKNPPLMMLLV